MARAVVNTSALVMLWCVCGEITAASAAAPGKLELPDVSKLQPDSIYFLPLADEKCGEGNPMYYGVVTPKKINSTRKVWIESMGGAICFNERSCMDKEFNVWLDLLKTVKRYVRTTPPGFVTMEAFFTYLTAGTPLPLSLFRQLRTAYFPNEAGGPLEGEVGFYYPSCTGDAGLGNYEVTYSGSQVIRHSGGASYMILLQAIQQAFSDIERVTMIGASGSAVSRVAWAPTVADMFPTAEVKVVADSAMHVLPGTEVFKYFWREVQWCPNPDGRHDLAQIYAPDMKSLPSFDWRSPSTISDMLWQYGGRIKLLYIGCNNDNVIVGDRILLSDYANFWVPTDKEKVEEEMWDFLQRLTRDAPAGSAFSYISQGTCHHQTRNGFMAAINAADPSDIGPESFTEAFLKGEVPAPAHIWCCNKTPSTPVTTTSAPATTTSAPAMEHVSSAVSPVPSQVALALAAAWASFAA